MRIHFVCRRGSLLPLAWRAKLEGADVSMYSPDAHGIGKRLVPTARKAIPDTPPDAVVCDCGQWAARMDRLRDEGVRVIGGHPLGDLVASDPMFVREALNAAGYTIAEESDLDAVVGLHAWYEDGFQRPYALVLPQMRMLNGDRGAPAPAPTTLSAFACHQTNPLLNLLDPLADRLRDYRGPVVLYCYPESREVVGLQLEIDAVLYAALAEMVDGGLSACLSGEAPPYRTEDGDQGRRELCGLAVASSFPPYPHGAASAYHNAPLSMEDGAKMHVWPTGLARHREEGAYYYTAASATVAYISACGYDQAEARRRVLRTLERFAPRAMQYRTDGGRDATKRLGKLLAMWKTEKRDKDSSNKEKTNVGIDM